MLRVEVADVADVAAGVKVLTLSAVDGQELPAWTPGAHIDLALPSGLTRQYSLCSDPVDRTTYRIAVLRQLEGNGGSAELHRIASPGLRLSIRGPRNHFPLVAADNYIFVAGGIGITPILPMTCEAERRGTPWHLIYGGRDRDSMAFVEELQALGNTSVDIVPQDERGLLDLDRTFADVPNETAIYCCGPEALITAAQEIASARALRDALHIERFGKSVVAPRAEISAPFSVTCALSSISFTVPPDRSILDLVRERVDPKYPYSCTEGYCGSCTTRVLAGIPDHRDEILTDEERAENNVMMICVDRSLTEQLVLDL
jgi:ferredoxin-NADP reductase